MKPLAQLTLFVAAAAMRPVAAAPLASVSCPQAAPSTWNLPATRLDSVRVLSYPADRPPADGEALPILAPVREWTRAGTLYQRWDINFDAPPLSVPGGLPVCRHRALPAHGFARRQTVRRSRYTANENNQVSVQIGNAAGIQRSGYRHRMGALR